jgi:hypothetical protein
MKRLLSDKRAYFAAFGAVGGLLSSMFYGKWVSLSHI